MESAPGYDDGHADRVATGQEYQFSVDYSQLTKDPSGAKQCSGYLYAPGAPVAIWI